MNNAVKSEGQKNFSLQSLFVNKKFQYVIVFFFIILIVVFACSNITIKEKTETYNEVDLYVSNLEKKLSELLSEIDGAGKVKVAITVEAGKENVLATSKTVKETNGIKETTEGPIIVNGKTVTTKEMYPKIIGVLIVAEGANSISVMSKIQQATISLLKVNVNEIEILKMK